MLFLARMNLSLYIWQEDEIDFWFTVIIDNEGEKKLRSTVDLSAIKTQKQTVQNSSIDWKLNRICNNRTNAEMLNLPWVF